MVTVELLKITIASINENFKRKALMWCNVEEILVILLTSIIGLTSVC